MNEFPRAIESVFSPAYDWVCILLDIQILAKNRKKEKKKGGKVVCGGKGGGGMWDWSLFTGSWDLNANWTPDFVLIVNFFDSFFYMICVFVRACARVCVCVCEQVNPRAAGLYVRLCPKRYVKL